MLKRVSKGNHIRSINPLVDFYNSISSKYDMPCGGENIDKFAGNIRLTKAHGTEEFIPLGSEAVRTMLTEETKNAFLCIELVDETRFNEFKKALEELAALVEEYLGGTSKIFILDKKNWEVVIE